jgi:hypothetical protein
MFTKPLLLAAVLAVIAAAPTHAGPVLQGYKWNDIRLNGTVLQGYRWNGARRNGGDMNAADREDASIGGRVIAIEF